MPANKKSTALDSRDDAPDLSGPAWRDKFAKEPVRRGRPLSTNPKVMTTLRLDQDVLAAFRAEGPGWQSRINEELKAVVKRRTKKSTEKKREAKAGSSPQNSLPTAKKASRA